MGPVGVRGIDRGVGRLRGIDRGVGLLRGRVAGYLPTYLPHMASRLPTYLPTSHGQQAAYLPAYMAVQPPVIISTPGVEDWASRWGAAEGPGRQAASFMVGGC